MFGVLTHTFWTLAPLSLAADQVLDLNFTAECTSGAPSCCLQINKYSPTICIDFGSKFVAEFDVYQDETNKYTRYAVNRVQYVYDYFQEPIFDFVHKVCVNYDNFADTYYDVKIIPLKFTTTGAYIVLHSEKAVKVAFTSQTYHQCEVRGHKLTFFLEPDQKASETLVAYGLVDPLLVVQGPEVEEFIDESKCVKRAFSRDLNITTFPAEDLYVQQAWAWWTGAPYQQVYCLYDPGDPKSCVPYTTPFYLTKDDPHRAVRLRDSYIACAKPHTLAGGQLQSCDNDGAFEHVLLKVGYNTSWNDMDWLLTPLVYQDVCLQVKAKGERVVSLYCDSNDPKFALRPNITIDVVDKVTDDRSDIHIRSAQICIKDLEIVPVQFLGKEDEGLKNYCRLRKNVKTGVLRREEEQLVPGMTAKCRSILFMEDFVNFLALSVCIQMVSSCFYSLSMCIINKIQRKKNGPSNVDDAIENIILQELKASKTPARVEAAIQEEASRDVVVQQSQVILVEQHGDVSEPSTSSGSEGPMVPIDELEDGIAEAVVARFRSDIVIEVVVFCVVFVLIILILTNMYTTIVFSVLACVPFVLFIYHRIHQLMRFSRKPKVKKPRRQWDWYVFMSEAVMFVVNFLVYYVGTCLQYADFREVLRYLKIRVEQLTFKKLGFLGAFPRAYMNFLDYFKQKLNTNVTFMILPLVFFAVFNINQAGFRNPKFSMLFKIQNKKRINWIGFVAKQAFVLYGHLQCIISMLIFLVLEKFSFRNADGYYDSNIIQYLEIVIRIALACYFYTLTRHNMILQLYSCIAKTFAKVFSDLKIAAFSVPVFFFMLCYKDTRPRAWWSLLAACGHFFLVVADLWVCFIYPALLMSKEYENPLYFLLQLIGVIPPVQYLRDSVKISQTELPKNTKTKVKMILNYIQQTFGYLMICQFLNNQIYLDMFGPLLFTVILCFSIWIPAANFKQLAQLSLVEKMTPAQGYDLPELSGLFFKNHVEAMKKNAKMQDVFGEIETSYNGNVDWFTNYLADFILQAYYYLPGLGRIFAIFVPFFQQPNLMSNGRFHGWFPFLFNLAAAVTFVLHLILLIFSDGQIHFVPLAINYVLVAIVSQAAVSDFVVELHRFNWQDGLNYLIRRRNSCRKADKPDLEQGTGVNAK